MTATNDDRVSCKIVQIKNRFMKENKKKKTKQTKVEEENVLEHVPFYVRTIECA